MIYAGRHVDTFGVHEPIGARIRDQQCNTLKWNARWSNVGRDASATCTCILHPWKCWFVLQIPYLTWEHAGRVAFSIFAFA